MAIKQIYTALQITALSGLLLLSPPAHATIYKFGDAFLRATPARVSAGYVLINNPTAEPDTLLRASFAHVGRVELHTISADKNGVLQMQPTLGFKIGPKCTTALRTGGWHMMLYDLKKPLQAGDSLKGVLEFAKAGKKTVVFEIKPITYMGITPQKAELCP